MIPGSPHHASRHPHPSARGRHRRLPGRPRRHPGRDRRTPPGRRRDFLAAELESLAAENGVTGTVVVQTVLVPEETPELLAVAAASPVIAGVVGWLDLTAPDVAVRVAELRAGPGGAALVAIRHQVQL